MQAPDQHVYLWLALTQLAKDIERIQYIESSVPILLIKGNENIQLT